MTWSPPKELLIAVAAGFGIAALIINQQWSNAERGRSEAIVGKIAAELSAKTGQEQAAVMKSAKEAAEQALQTTREQLGQLQKSVAAANDALKAAEEQAKQALSAREAAEASAKAGQKLATEAEAAKELIARELSSLKAELKELKDKTAREPSDRPTDAPAPAGEAKL